MVKKNAPIGMLFVGSKINYVESAKHIQIQGLLIAGSKPNIGETSKHVIFPPVTKFTFYGLLDILKYISLLYHHDQPTKHDV